MTLLFVLSTYGVIYVHFVKMPKYDSWVPISRLNVLRKSIAFARFENRPAEDDVERVDVGIKFDVEGKLVEQTVTDFDNPLFESGQAASTSNAETDIGMVETSMQKIDNDESANESSSGVDLIDVNLQ